MCDPTLLIAATIGTTAATSLFSAGSQARAGERTGRLAVWQAVMDQKAALVDSANVFEEAKFTQEALVEQFGTVAGATMANFGQTARANLELFEDTTRGSIELLAETSRGTLEQLATTSTARVDQALKAARSYDLSMEVARANATLALAKGNLEENRSLAETGRALATTTAYFSANNMDPTYGSPLLLQAFGAAQGDADAKIIRASALQEAAAFEFERLGYAEKAADGVSGAIGGLDADYLAASRTLDSASAASQREIDFGARTVDRNIDASFQTATIGTEGGYKALVRQLESINRTATTQANSLVNSAGKGVTAATIAADNARKAGQLGAATTLLNTVSNWAQMGMSGKLAPIGIKV